MQDSRPEIARKRVKEKNKIKTGVAYSVPLTLRIKKKKKKKENVGRGFFSIISEALVPLHRCAFNGVFLPAIFNSSNVPSSLPCFLLVLSNRLFLLNFFVVDLSVATAAFIESARNTEVTEK